MQLVRHVPFTTNTVAARAVRPSQPCIAVGRSRCHPAKRVGLHCPAAAPDQPASQEPPNPEEVFVGIPPEEDVEVPGTYFDALNPQTKLGKAVRAAVDELNHLNAMEMETLQQCDALLKKLGIKTSILQAPTAPQQAPEEEQ